MGFHEVDSMVNSLVFFLSGISEGEKPMGFDTINSRAFRCQFSPPKKALRFSDFMIGM